jgi:hypothetical protein
MIATIVSILLTALSYDFPPPELSSFKKSTLHFSPLFELSLLPQTMDTGSFCSCFDISILRFYAIVVGTITEPSWFGSISSKSFSRKLSTP